MSSSVGIMTFPISGQTKHVPNHQPAKMMFIDSKVQKGDFP
jgi:hypothetical protein